MLEPEEELDEDDEPPELLDELELLLDELLDELLLEELLLDELLEELLEEPPEEPPPSTVTGTAAIPPGLVRNPMLTCWPALMVPLYGAGPTTYWLPLWERTTPFHIWVIWASRLNSTVQSDSGTGSSLSTVISAWAPCPQSLATVMFA